MVAFPLPDQSARGARYAAQYLYAGEQRFLWLGESEADATGRFLARLLTVLRLIQDDWAAMSREAAYVGKPGDPQRMLLDDGKPLRLGGRALDILLTLVESAGKTIPKDQLIARTWPDTVSPVCRSKRRICDGET